MNRDPGDYISVTRHPWPCFLFLLPFLVAYEGGVLWLGGTHPEALRNGADTWLHWGLDSFGLHELYWGPALIAAGFLAWSWWRREDRPYDLLGVYLGMAVESVVFALALWVLSREVSPFLEKYGNALSAEKGVRNLLCEAPFWPFRQKVPDPFFQLPGSGRGSGGEVPLCVVERSPDRSTQRAAWPGQETVPQLAPAPSPPNPAVVHVITFLGAGIYEEVLFRLFLFTGLVWLAQHMQIPRLGAIPIAAIGSALLFAAAHNIGPYGEKFDGYVFLFRALAGVYFALLFKMRGFGIAVGAHAIYDILVGVLFNSAG